MRKSKLCTLLVAIALPLSLWSCVDTRLVSQESRKYIGHTYPPTPPSVKEVGGFMIQPLDGAEYGLFQVVDRGVTLVWFMRLLARSADGRPLWKIVDVPPLPPLQQGDVVLYASCGQSREYDFEVIAIAKDEKAHDFPTTVRQAWRLLRRAGKFEEVAISGNKCVRDGFPNPKRRNEVMVQNVP